MYDFGPYMPVHIREAHMDLDALLEDGSRSDNYILIDYMFLCLFRHEISNIALHWHHKISIVHGMNNLDLGHTYSESSEQPILQS